MTDQSESSSKEKTIFLAILLFGGFTVLLIFYLVYKYFKMRRNDIEQQRMIEQHNQLQKRRFRKKQNDKIPENVLTQSILNWNVSINQKDSLTLGCRNCGKNFVELKRIETDPSSEKSK